MVYIILIEISWGRLRKISYWVSFMLGRKLNLFLFWIQVFFTIFVKVYLFLSLSDSWINGDFPEFIVYRYYWISVLSWFKSESQELMFSIPRLFMTGTKLRRLLQGGPNIIYNSFSKFSVKSTHNFDNVDEFCLKKEDCTNNWTQIRLMGHPVCY